MIWLEIWFWLCALGIVYVYLGYPLLVGAAARVFGRPLQRVAQLPRSISIVIAAHDEEATIARRIRELNEQLSWRQFSCPFISFSAFRRTGPDRRNVHEC